MLSFKQFITEAKFGFDVHKMNIDFDDYVKKIRPEYLEWLKDKRESDGPGSEKIGPHEGKYFNLMKQKLKPMAIVDKDELKYFKPLIKSGLVSNEGILLDSSYILVLKGEEWRARQLRKIITSDKPDNLYDEKVGKLLGYSNSEIRHYTTR